jgi:hypothetical protein
MAQRIEVQLPSGRTFDASQQLQTPSQSQILKSVQMHHMHSDTGREDGELQVGLILVRCKCHPLLKESDPHVVRVVINQEHAVAQPMRGRHIDKSPNVRRHAHKGARRFRACQRISECCTGLVLETLVTKSFFYIARQCRRSMDTVSTLSV